MFGLTKRQFLKKSKKCLRETGIQILLLRELMDKEAQESLSPLDAHRNLDNIRRNIEDTFNWYEKLNPPTKCLPLQQKIMNSLIVFHEAAVKNSESLIALENGLEEEFKNKLRDSKEELQKFLETFQPLIKEVDLYLLRK